MRIHREGTVSLVIFALVAGSILFFLRNSGQAIFISVAVLIIILGIFLLQFFRNPVRKIYDFNDGHIYAPADGKVVVIERATEPEFFKDERLQVSIFMSPLNVHVNRCASSGKIAYSKYHRGKYLVAWHPKSSTENERYTTVIENEHGSVLYRQIAGALARRIVNYLKTGDSVKQGEEMGFIKFGSRMDIFLPLDAEVKVELGQSVRGNLDLIAKMN